LIHQSCPKVPDNSVINNTGDGYNCNLKFYKDLTKNLCVSPPQNASVNATGDGYKCNANFYLSGSTCIKKPDHSSVSPSGTDYVCDENFIRGITATTLYQCVPGCSDPKKVLYSGKCYLSPGEGGNLNTSTGVVDCKAGYYASAGVSGQKIDATPALQCALLPARGVANIGTSGFHCETNFIVSGGSCAALKCPATIPGSSGPANFNGYKPTYIVSDGKCILDPKNYPPSTWYLPAQATDAKGTYVLYCGTAVDSRYGTGVWALNSTQGFFLSNSGNDFKDIHTGPACCGGTANGETMSRTKCSPSGNYPVLPTQLYLSVPAVQ
jgi:hypothetical protein